MGKAQSLLLLMPVPSTSNSTNLASSMILHVVPTTQILTTPSSLLVMTLTLKVSNTTPSRTPGEVGGVLGATSSWLVTRAICVVSPLILWSPRHPAILHR